VEVETYKMAMEETNKQLDEQNKELIKAKTDISELTNLVSQLTLSLRECESNAITRGDFEIAKEMQKNEREVQRTFNKITDLSGSLSKAIEDNEKAVIPTDRVEDIAEKNADVTVQNLLEEIRQGIKLNAVIAKTPEEKRVVQENNALTDILANSLAIRRARVTLEEEEEETEPQTEMSTIRSKYIGNKLNENTEVRRGHFNLKRKIKQRDAVYKPVYWNPS